MDSFNFYNIKAEKANAIQRYQQRRKIANMFRFVEVFVVLVLISRFSLQLPHAVKNSGGYFRDLSVVLVSPRFVFVVGNVIVIILFAKSGKFSGGNSGESSFYGDDLYDEFVKNSEKNQKAFREGADRKSAKESTGEKNRVAADEVENSSTTVTATSWEIKKYERSNSENLETQKKSNRQVLRRSETEKIGKDINQSLCTEDYTSNDEFQQKVEAFIARQQSDWKKNNTLF